MLTLPLALVAKVVARRCFHEAVESTDAHAGHHHLEHDEQLLAPAQLQASPRRRSHVHAPLYIYYR